VLHLKHLYARIFRAIGDELNSRLSKKEIAPVNSYEGFTGRGEVVLRDRRGTLKAEIPDAAEKGFAGGSDPLAIYKPTGAKEVDAAKAMANFRNWSYAAVNAIASEVANIQLRLYQVNGDDHEEQEDHPLLTLLEGVNEHMTGIELKYVTMAHLELTGNCYWLLDGVSDDMTPPRAIYPLNPGTVRLKLNKAVFPYKLSHYEFTIDGKIFRFEPYQILHLKYPDPSDPFVGIGIPQTIPTWIDSDNYAMEYNRKFFINGAQVGLYIQTDTNVEANIDRIRKGFGNRHEGVENAHKVPVLPKGAKLEHTGLTQRDMDFHNLTEATRDRILAGFRVSKTILGTAESDTNRACYDDQTEVLTETGWKRYFEVKDGEKIAEYDGERNVVRFALPLGKYVYPYKGKMLHFENCKMDIMVTPDHRMWYRPDHKGAKYRIERAEKLPKICYFKAAAPQNDGEQVDLFTLPYYEKGSHPEIIGRTFYMDDWLEFLGYVISEGGVSSQAKNWVITLYQKKQPHQDKIRACLKRLEASGCLTFGEYQTPGEDGVRFNVHGKPLVMWMHEFIGSYCTAKRIPDFVFKLCRRQRQIIFDALMVGDGSIDPRENRKSGYYSTTSHELADDVQRLAFSLGIEAKVATHYEANGNRSTCYRVMLDFGTAEQQLDFQHRGMRREIDYDGYVWCFQTNTGLFVTRRNGKIALQGNTAETAD
jgi:HK97 family phage portal protein